MIARDGKRRSGNLLKNNYGVATMDVETIVRMENSFNGIHRVKQPDRVKKKNRVTDHNVWFGTGKMKLRSDNKTFADFFNFEGGKYNPLECQNMTQTMCINWNT